jgi:hypothetical protein
MRCEAFSTTEEAQGRCEKRNGFCFFFPSFPSKPTPKRAASEDIRRTLLLRAESEVYHGTHATWISRKTLLLLLSVRKTIRKDGNTAGVPCESRALGRFV